MNLSIISEYKVIRLDIKPVLPLQQQSQMEQQPHLFSSTTHTQISGPPDYASAIASQTHSKIITHQGSSGTASYVSNGSGGTLVPMPSSNQARFTLFRL